MTLSNANGNHSINGKTRILKLGLKYLRIAKRSARMAGKNSTVNFLNVIIVRQALTSKKNTSFRSSKKKKIEREFLKREQKYYKKTLDTRTLRNYYRRNGAK
ncbi:hypothetical protein HAX54_008949 [Datura stramonium]|uniref:Uncharacterized protein n=1 Tax=Datura stramonium TaxID=4076 RepID=A0ABS8RVV2_DATST|nr:hypothetical protein [Datura stramonium]